MLVTIVIDSTFVKFFGIDESRLPSIFTVIFFICMVVVLFVTSMILLRFSSTDNSELSRNSASIKSLHRGIKMNQYVIFGVIAYIALSMLILFHYSIFSIWIILLITHGEALILLGLSVYRFILWLRVKRNYPIFIYSVAFSCLVITILSSIMIASEILPHNRVLVTPVSSQMLLMSYYSNSETIMLKNIYQTFFVTAFILSWLATIFLLRHYSRKFGKIKFLVLILIPLLYFLSQFEIQFIDIFQEIRLDYPVAFSIVYFIFFSATKQVGGLLFGLALWTAAKKFKHRNVRNSLILSAIGVTFIFAADQIDSLLLVPYPPFGIVSISVLGLAAYFLFRGFLNTALFISRDLSLRKELYKEIENNISILRTMGLSEMERSLTNKCKPLLKKAIATENNYKEIDIDVEDAKILVQEVVQEVYSDYKHRENGNKNDTEGSKNSK